jgi:hypothetical protein
MIKKHRNIILHDHLEYIFRKGDYCWGRREYSLTIIGKFKPRPHKNVMTGAYSSTFSTFFCVSVHK